LLILVWREVAFLFILAWRRESSSLVVRIIAKPMGASKGLVHLLLLVKEPFDVISYVWIHALLIMGESITFLEGIHLLRDRTVSGGE